MFIGFVNLNKHFEHIMLIVYVYSKCHRANSLNSTKQQFYLLVNLKIYVEPMAQKQTKLITYAIF